MSIEVMTAVWKHAPVQSGELLILLALADYADEDGGSFPAVETLAKKARMSGRNVQLCLKSLADADLIRIEKNGGPKGCNRYYVQVANLVRKPACSGNENPVSGEGGENISPLKNDAGGVKSATSGGEVGFTQTVRESTKESVIERESAGAGREVGENLEPASGQGMQPEPVVEADRTDKQREALFWRAVKDWKDFAAMPKRPALKAWMALTDREMDDFLERREAYFAELKRAKRDHWPAPSTCFAEKLWTHVPVAEAQPKPTERVVVPPFGPQWMALRLWRLGQGATVLPPLTEIEADMLAKGMSGAEFVTEKRRKAAYPQIRSMDAEAALARGVTLLAEQAAGLARDAAGYVPVSNGSPLWEAWKARFDALGWPWLPDMGRHPTAYFPAEGPDGFMNSNTEDAA